MKTCCLGKVLNFTLLMLLSDSLFQWFIQGALFFLLTERLWSLSQSWYSPHNLIHNRLFMPHLSLCSTLFVLHHTNPLFLLTHMHFHTQVPLLMLCLLSCMPYFQSKLILQGLAQTCQVFHNLPLLHPISGSQYFTFTILPENSHIFTTSKLH